MFAVEEFLPITQAIEQSRADEAGFQNWLTLRADKLQKHQVPAPEWKQLHVSGLPVVPPVLREHAETVYAVGGAVRDALLGQTYRDVEFVVPWQNFYAIAEGLARTPGSSVRTFARTRTAKISVDGEKFEIAAMRRDTYDEGGNLAGCIGAEIGHDALRRDFTCNALYYCSASARLYNPFGWLPGDPLDQVMPGTLAEDPLRIIRLFRFAHRLAMTPGENATLEARLTCQTHWPNQVHGARVAAELNRAARSGVLGNVLKDLQTVGWPMPNITLPPSVGDSPEKSCIRWAARHLNAADSLAFRSWLNL